MNLGVMLTLRDFRTLTVPGTSFSELLLHNGDLEKFDMKLLQDVIIHAHPPIKFIHTQEFITYDGREELLDLTSEDPELRSLSVRTVNRTRDIATLLGGAQVVFHPGGIRKEAADRPVLLANFERSLRILGPFRLLMENMPWYYWLKKSEKLRSNIGITIEDMLRFAAFVEGVVLDTSHGYLSKPHGDAGFSQKFMTVFGRKVQHLHVSDALAPDREGLQIGDGRVDFSFLQHVSAPVLVEVWNGHESRGQGFKTAIERIRMLERAWSPTGQKAAR